MRGGLGDADSDITGDAMVSGRAYSDDEYEGNVTLPGRLAVVTCERTRPEFVSEIKRVIRLKESSSSSLGI